MKLNGNVIIFSGIILFVLYMIISTIWYSPRVRDSKFSSYNLVQGQFEEIGVFSIGINTNTTYSYMIGGRKILGEIGGKIPCKQIDRNENLKNHEIWNIRFPVAVSVEDPVYSMPLLSPDDFKALGIGFPDSMRVFYEKYLDCNFWQTHFYQ